MYEILSPAGNMEKLKTAVYFGADAVYFSGKNFGLRAYANNFTNEEIKSGVEYCHNHNVKAYVTVNIVAHNKDFLGLKDYLIWLDKCHVDGLIICDIGIMEYVKKYVPNMPIHVSTQANVTNKYTAKFLADYGVKRIVLARELTLSEIKEIHDYVGDKVELEAFVHGAMCISYSGRCLLSNFLSNRSSNKGECIQACRWKYMIHEASRENELLPIEEDKYGTYILNSKDLNMIEHLKELIDCGVTSFKIEGRMKTSYYVATVVNAYKRALNDVLQNKEFDSSLLKELDKASNRGYTTGLYYKDKRKEESECLESSEPKQTHDFVGVVVDSDGEKICVEQRNRFMVGDSLEVLSPSQNFNKVIKIEKMYNKNNEEIMDAKNVQEQVFICSHLKLQKGDILRKKR